MIINRYISNPYVFNLFLIENGYNKGFRSTSELVEFYDTTKEEETLLIGLVENWSVIKTDE